MKINIPWTLSGYFLRSFSVWFGGVFLALFSLIFVFELLELFRRSATKADATFGIVFHMAVLKTPSVLMQLTPFCVLISTLLTFRKLQKKFELVTARASGLSLSQLLLPLTAFCVLLGCTDLFLMNPLKASALAKFERLNTQYLKRQKSQITFSETGLWLRQFDEKNQYTLLRVQNIHVSDRTAQGVSLYVFNEPDVFLSRSEIKSAKMNDGFWELEDIQVFEPHKPVQVKEKGTFKTSFTPEGIEENFTNPETISFWDLGSYITALEQGGFSGIAHRFYWHTLISKPFLMLSMVLLAACFSLQWRGRTSIWGWTALGTLGSGFVYYILNDILRSLALSYALPLSVAIWAPIVTITLVCSAYLLHIENG